MSTPTMFSRGRMSQNGSTESVHGPPWLQPPLGIHHGGVQWEGGAVDWGSIMEETSV